MEAKEIKGLWGAYVSVYTNLSESHFKVGDKVICKKSGMKGEVVKLDKPDGAEDEKYYTVEREDGKKMKYAPNELKSAGNGGASKESETEFHTKLDKLVHKTFGSSPEEKKKMKEEVEIAAQYFYEMGLNEDGVDILIEELGLEGFVEFVYDISEEYVLTEARAGGVKIEPKLASGKAIQGKPKAASLKRLRSQKAARSEEESKASASKPSGMKASLQRQSAISAAAKKQPKKPGLLDRVAGAINKGIERHNAAMSAAKETGKTIRKAAGKVGGVAREVGKGASGATKLAGRIASKGLSDEYIMGYLIDEGYAETPEAALVIMANMSEEWREDIVEAAKDQSDKQIEKGVKTTYKAGNVIDNQHQGRSRGLSRLPAGERSEKTKRMRERLKGRRDDLFKERGNREDAARAELKKRLGL